LDKTDKRVDAAATLAIQVYLFLTPSFGI